MKTKEELNELKEEVEKISRKLSELNEEELAQVSGGIGPGKFIGIMPGILIADTAISTLLMKNLK